MENETLQLAKLVAWPPMRGRYGVFHQCVSRTLTAPALQAISQTLGTIRDLPEGSGPALDNLAEETLRRCQGSLRGPNGKIETSPAKVAMALESLREATTRLEGYTKPEKLKSETSFREWLERGIVTSSAHEEPSFLPGSDPIQKALETLGLLKATALAFGEDEDALSFPLSNYKLKTKPKTPTAMDPFDSVELEGGAEEDTVMILSGESNIGKSHLGLFCLSSLSLRREAVLLCSGEDSLETTRRRIFAHYLRKTAKEVAVMTEEERMKEFEALYGDRENPESLLYHITNNMAVACIPEGTFTPKAIDERIDTFEQKRGMKIKAFMADYLQKMTENPAGKNSRRMRDEELEATVNQIKDLCQTRKTFGLVISQVPSHAAGGNFEFLNLKQAVARSYAATWGAHYVVTVNRTAEETKRLASSSDKRPRLNLFLCKNKEGPLGVCYVLGYPSEARWEFFRTKPELVAQIEAEAEATHTPRTELDPDDYRATRNFPGRGLV
jgi:hypothetical protein